MDERWEEGRDGGGGGVKRMDACVHGWHGIGIGSTGGWCASATSDNAFSVFRMKCFLLFFSRFYFFLKKYSFLLS
jgi:hypothetical protein